jgi:hypothetical protein
MTAVALFGAGYILGGICGLLFMAYVAGGDE